jgi:hypothetical protein
MLIKKKLIYQIQKNIQNEWKKLKKKWSQRDINMLDQKKRMKKVSLEKRFYWGFHPSQTL